MIVVKYLAVALLGYLLGSIPFGVIISKKSARVDVRKVGSGKMGTTNVLRVAGKKAAAMVVILDIAKGALAVLLAGFIFTRNYVIVSNTDWLMVYSAQVLAAFAAITGHSWPVFVKFKGGRGVATFFGGLVALCPPAALFGGEVLILGAGLTRYMSVGSIAGAVGSYVMLTPLTIVYGFPIVYLAYALAGSIFIIVMHRDNIARLLAGTERKLGEKAKLGRLSPGKPAKPDVPKSRAESIR